jgi:hypothetical protein
MGNFGLQSGQPKFRIHLCLRKSAAKSQASESQLRNPGQAEYLGTAKFLLYIKSIDKVDDSAYFVKMNRECIVQLPSWLGPQVSCGL